MRYIDDVIRWKIDQLIYVPIRNLVSIKYKYSVSSVNFRQLALTYSRGASLPRLDTSPYPASFTASSTVSSEKCSGLAYEFRDNRTARDASISKHNSMEPGCFPTVPNALMMFGLLDTIWWCPNATHSQSILSNVCLLSGCNTEKLYCTFTRLIPSIYTEY